MRVYSVIYSTNRSVRHTGFCKLRQVEDAETGTLVATVWFEGEPEAYSIDDMSAVASLRQFYVDAYGDHDYPITVSMVLG